MVPAAEVYSIDEAFADLTGVPGDLERLGRQIRAEVYRRTGIPVGVGIASTKTLASWPTSLPKNGRAIQVAS